jgi:hypothetical protein
LFDPPQPEPLLPIGAPERRELVRAVMRKARPDAAGGTDADAARVQRLAEQANDATEALDALMARLTVATASGHARLGRPASRVEMADALAAHERRRVSTIASDRDLSISPWTFDGSRTRKGTGWSSRSTARSNIFLREEL